MRSFDEQSPPGEDQNSRELILLTQLVEAPEATQRELSKTLGMALGLTNLLIRDLTRKGFVRVAKSSWNRRLYTLTPKGFSHKIRLMNGYVRRFLNDYRIVRNTLREQLAPLSLHAESRIAIYGTGEFAELVYLGIRELGIDEIRIFASDDSEDKKFLGIPVQLVSQLEPDEYDWVLIAHLANPEADCSKIQSKGVNKDRLVTFLETGMIRDKQ